MTAKKTKLKNDLAQINSGTLSNRVSVITIGALELALLKMYPAVDAEEWDHTGLIVGDPAELVGGVAVALDPTVEAIKETKAVGANVLITHHPAFLTAPDSFRPSDSVALNSGAGVWAAIENGIALMNFHTALDVSQDAARMLPSMLRLKFEGILDPINEKGNKGYGQISSVTVADAPLSLGQFAARCTSVFGRHPRVWGDFDRKVSKIVTCTGSSGDLSIKCLEAKVDVLVCGEIRYHDALAASQAGLAIVDLGHDTSELPLVATLVSAVEKVGVNEDRIVVIDQSSHWDSPESMRV